MKGLLIKDIKILKLQKLLFIILIGAIFVVAFFSSSYSFSSGFVCGYSGFVIPMLVVSTISYDEFDNGNAFLFTLPFNRREYVIEKYIIGILSSLIFLVLTVVGISCIGYMRGYFNIEELGGTAGITLVEILLFLSILIPIQLKFGAEKSKYAIIAVVGGCAAAVFVIWKLFELSNVNIIGFINTLSGLSMFAISVIIAASAIIILALSIKISFGIMSKKEF